MVEQRALLLTDVVGSTALAEQLGDQAMAAAWAAHDRAARDLLLLHGGREIDKSDGMLLLFARAADAAAYAVAYHRALAALPVPLEARTGLHVGPVLLRENPPEDVARGAKPLEVEGLAKPMAARVMSLAGAGQLLLTQEALDAVGPPAALGLAHCSHGHWLLKGLSEPVELFELGEDATRLACPPDGDKVHRVVRVGERWLPVREIPNNLPHASTQFVGRERELLELAGLLQRTRLVTLLGMGGLGKTRLSLQLAAETLASHPDGAWFLDLSALRDPALVVAEAARVFELGQEPGRALLDTVCAHLRHRRALLVVDNCEHLLDAAAEFVWAVLKAAPGLRVLASSRELLDVPGEQAYPVLPLPLPAQGDGARVLERCTAVRLFVDRVRLHRPDFAITEDAAADLVTLVARLEGIPLALELAAARMRDLDLHEILAGLAQRYEVLRGGSRRLQARQQTLQALVDWSYDMLSPQERCVYARLSGFAGGFTPEAAAVVCAAEPVPPEAVPGLLRALAEKSLVMQAARGGGPAGGAGAGPGDGGARLRMLETLREHAALRLDAMGEADAVAARHARLFFDLAKKGRDGMLTAEQGLWLQRLDDDLGNLRAAAQTARAGRGGVDPFVAVKMAVALQNFWIMRGIAAQGRALVQELLAMPAVQSSPMAKAHALYVGAALALAQSELAEGAAMLQECLALRRDFSHPQEIASTLSSLGVAQLGLGEPEAAGHACAEALALFSACGFQAGEAIAQLQLAQVALWQDSLDEARRRTTAALDLARAIGHLETQAEALLVLCELDARAGRADAAQASAEASRAICLQAGDRRGAALALAAAGRLRLQHGQAGLAAPALREALVECDACDMREPWLRGLEDHARLALAQGQAAQGVALWAACQRLRERARLAGSPAERAVRQGLADALRAACSDDAHAQALAEGRSWDTAEAQRHALALHPAAAA